MTGILFPVNRPTVLRKGNGVGLVDSFPDLPQLSSVISRRAPEGVRHNYRNFRYWCHRNEFGFPGCHWPLKGFLLFLDIALHALHGCWFSRVFTLPTRPHAFNLLALMLSTCFRVLRKTLGNSPSPTEIVDLTYPITCWILGGNYGKCSC